MFLPTLDFNFGITKKQNLMSSTITCPTGCTGALPPVLNNPCEIECCFAQISEIYFSTVGNPIADPNDSAEWTARLDNTDTTDPTRIRTLCGIGNLNDATFTTIELPKCREKYSDKTYSLTFRVLDLNDENWDFYRFICDCNASFEMIGYGDVKGKHVFVQEEQTTVSISAQHNFSQDKDALQELTFTLTWTGKAPCRVPKPF